MSYYIKSGVITLTLDTGIDIAAATVKKILYKSPSGAVGSWDATSVGTSLTYTVSNTDIDIPGVWQFQTYVEIAGKKGYGEVVNEAFAQTLN